MAMASAQPGCHLCVGSPGGRAMRAGSRAAAVGAFTALALFGWVPLTGTEPSPDQRPEAHRYERLVDAVNHTTAALGAVRAKPGVRPPFIPRQALVVRGQSVHVVTLAEALSGRAGMIVGWVP